MNQKLESIKSRVEAKLLSAVNATGLFSKNRECPLCGWTGFKFLSYGNSVKRRPDAQCPNCLSLERHRLVYLLTKEVVGSNHETLHIAPESQVTRWLKSISRDYLSIDLFASAMQKMDLTDLKLDNESKTLIFCSHVLEHIPDDTQAMSEMYRVLKHGGLAIIQVPIWRQETYEDFSISTKEGRLKAFFQEDHVRLYGLDLKERLESVGFNVCIEDINSLDSDIVKYHALDFISTKEVFICRKD